jgi:hypothetical protein
MYCTNCGTELAAAANFCGYCGTKVEGLPEKLGHADEESDEVLDSLLADLADIDREQKNLAREKERALTQNLLKKMVGYYSIREFAQCLLGSGWKVFSYNGDFRISYLPVKYIYIYQFGEWWEERDDKIMLKHESRDDYTLKFDYDTIDVFLKVRDGDNIKYSDKIPVEEAKKFLS